MSAVTFPHVVVATYGNTDPTAPLVVLLHGRGSNEADILGLAAHLPVGPAYAAVRAPIAEGGGYAWFANRGIGRPLADSLRSTMDWFRTWLDDVAPTGRPVLLVGFSGGAAFAGGLVLDDPSRYAGAAILYGTLPFEAGLDTDPGRLANLPSSSPRAMVTTSSRASCSTGRGPTCSPTPAPPRWRSASPVATS